MTAVPIFAPDRWLLIFETKAHWLVRRLCPGSYKHVSAAGYVPAIDTWLVFTVEIEGTRIGAFRPGSDFNAWLAGAVASAGVLRWKQGAASRFPPVFTFWCVPAVKHLCGIGGGALWPDQLWRYCVANGAEVVSDENAPAGYSGKRPGKGDADRVRGTGGAESAGPGRA